MCIIRFNKDVSNQPATLSDCKTAFDSLFTFEELSNGDSKNENGFYHYLERRALNYNVCNSNSTAIYVHKNEAISTRWYILIYTNKCLLFKHSPSQPYFNGRNKKVTKGYENQDSKYDLDQYGVLLYSDF